MQPLSLAKYPYVHGNPVNGVDPSGLFDPSLSSLKAGEVIEKFLYLVGQSLQTYLPFYISVATAWSFILGAALIALEYRLNNSTPDPDEMDKRRLRIPFIVWGLDYGVTTIHTYRALHGESYTNPPNNAIFPLFNYKRPGQPRAGWYNDKIPCFRRDQFRPERLVCDEFPYASTEQGGESNYNQGKVSLALVPSAEQNFVQKQPLGQGGALNIFYRDGLPKPYRTCLQLSDSSQNQANRTNSDFRFARS